MQGIDVNALHDALLKAGNVEEPIITCKIDCESGENDVKDGETHEEEADAVFVSFIESSLSLDHAPQPQVRRALSRLFWVLVNTTHTLVAHIKD